MSKTSSVFPWAQFKESFFKEASWKRQIFVRQGLMSLLDSELFEQAFHFLLMAPWFQLEICLEDFFYLFVDEIANTDSRNLLEKRKKKLLTFLKYIEEKDPVFYSTLFRECCLRHLGSSSFKDFSEFFAWKGFTNDSPTNLFGIGHEWLKETLFFYVSVGNHSETTDYIFNDAFLNRLCVRGVGELRNLEKEYYSVTIVRDKIDKNTLETFCFFAEAIGFGIGAGSHTEDYGFFMPTKTIHYHKRAIQTRSHVYHENYVAAIERLPECALFLYMINPEQFLEAIKAYKFHHELVPFLKYFYEGGGGKATLEERYWYKGIKALRSIAQ